jgi:membrane protein implicated in regulation of membrane protease activity
MILFILTGSAPTILILALVLMCYLAGVELWKEKDLPFLIKAWWVLLVLLLNIVGLAVFWIWLALRRRKRARSGPPERVRQSDPA